MSCSADYYIVFWSGSADYYVVWIVPLHFPNQTKTADFVQLIGDRLSVQDKISKFRDYGGLKWINANWIMVYIYCIVYFRYGQR